METMTAAMTALAPSRPTPRPDASGAAPTTHPHADGRRPVPVGRAGRRLGRPPVSHAGAGVHWPRCSCSSAGSAAAGIAAPRPDPRQLGAVVLAVRPRQPARRDAGLRRSGRDRVGLGPPGPRRARPPGDRPRRARTALAWIAPLLVSPPLFTRDPFSYLAQGALPLAGFDPYAVGPDAMGGVFTDNVHYFWQDTPAPYGPLFILLAKGVVSPGRHEPDRRRAADAAAALHRPGPAARGAARR